MQESPLRNVVRAALCGLVVAFSAQAQNAAPATQVANKGAKPISSADMRSWNSIRQNVLSNDGKWFAYVTGSSEGDATLVLRGTADGAKETRVSVGNGGGTPTISGDSKWIGYIVAPPRGAGGAGGARGGRGGAPGGGGGARGGRGGRGGGAPGGAAGDSSGAAQPNANANKFVLMNLSTGATKTFERIRRFSFNTDDATWIAMQGYSASAEAGDSAGAAGRGGAGGRGGRGGRGGAPAGAPGAESGAGANLLLYNISTGDLFNMGEVNQYAFNEDGDWLAYTMATSDQIGNGVQLRNMTNNATTPLESDQLLYSHLAWVDSSRSLSVMRGKINAATRDTAFSVEVFGRLGPNGAATKKMLFTTEGRSDFPAGWKLASDRAPRYSDDMSAVFVGIREGIKPLARGQVAGNARGGLVQPGAPGAGGTINQTAAGRGAGGAAAADELPSLVLWHYKDPRLQSQQIVQEAADRAFNYLSEYRFDDNKFIKLADDRIKNINISAGDKFAYGTDNADYEERASYTGRNYSDYYTFDLRTGEKKLLWKKRPGGGGGGLNVSPDGKKALYWGTDGNYWVLNLATHDTLNITKGVPTSFVNTEDDHNNLYPPAIAARGWTRDNSAVLLSDNWDIWKVSATAGTPAVNLTGNGKKDQIKYQTIYQWADEAAAAGAGGRGGRGGRGGGRGGRGGGGGGGEGIDLTKPIHIQTYGEWTKKEGLSVLQPGQVGAKSIYFEDARFTIEKAKNADTYVYTKQTFTEFPDYWVFKPGFAGGYQITDANPQIKELAWSSGTRLINYTSAKGDKLQGALYLPANYEPGKKYPLLVTIYEKRSQQKNGFVNPSETRAPDPTLFTSRGYAVLDPDIVYKVNDPGMSAVWCVIPAVKAAIADGAVDGDKVGLWGHSWGGYQTAFLVTQTNIFKAAIAGAPLTNMVSMYASIYWNTGGSDASIFESSQGRFKGNFIDNYDAYIRNSPVFHADKVQTPLIILQNDKDGAVDFNQGVTYFNTLRQLGKNVIFLEYVGENHGLGRPVNQRDYAVRMSEWFDHYLKGAPAADWIQNGVPRLKMEEHLQGRKDTTIVAGRIIIP